MCELKTWLGKWNKRLSWAVFYLILGISFIFIVFNKSITFPIVYKWVGGHWDRLLWVVGWSSIGISAWLINSRKGQRDKECLHYVFYFCFALFVSSLTAFALGKSSDGSFSFSLSALIGLTIGFASERLNELGPPWK